jgi:hypothetical protein
MVTKLNKRTYEKLIEGNLAWLAKQPISCERTHIIEIVKISPQHEFDDQKELNRLKHHCCVMSRALKAIEYAGEACPRPTCPGCGLSSPNHTEDCILDAALKLVREKD